MKYLITLSYDGSKYHGFQRLCSKKTVQGEIEKALTIINKTKVEIKGAGRTDRGVHAYGQRAHFELDINIPPENLIRALNGILKKSIFISNCEIVDKMFHARHDVKEKEYCYHISLGEYDPLCNDYMLQLDYDLDIKKIKKVAKLFLGIHNFKKFVSGYRESYNAIIYDIWFEEVNNVLLIHFKGKSFYRYMIRNLVGALLEIGRGKIEESDIIKLLENPDADVTVPTAPANGLYLMHITY